MEPQPKVGWAETRRLLELDLAVYGPWTPRLNARWPGWMRFAYVLCVSEMFGANVLYRLQIYLEGAHLHGFATLCRRLASVLFQVSIGPEVRAGGGLYIAHGHVVMAGRITLGSNVCIAPFVTLGLTNSASTPFDLRGPELGDAVIIGTGAKLLGPIRIGHRTLIGANAVVVNDVPDDHTAAGVPARSWPRPAGPDAAAEVAVHGPRLARLS